MSTVRKIAKNTSLLVLSNIISLVMGFTINILIARAVSVEDFGAISWALNLATIFIMLTDFGIGTFLAIELPRNPDRLKTYLNNALSLRIGLSIIALITITAVALAGQPTPIETQVLALISLYVVLQSVSQVMQAVFQASQAMKYLAVSQILHATVLVLGAIAVVWLNLGIVIFAGVYLLAALCILGYTTGICALHYVRPWPSLDFPAWKQIVSIGLPLSVAAVFSILYFKIDIQLIELLLGKTDVGYYTAAFKLVEAAVVLPALYTSVVFPLISLYFHKDDPYLRLLLRKSVKYLYMLGAPIAVGTILLADKFIYTLYPAAYAPSIDVLRLLGLGMLFMFVNSVPGSFLAAANLQRANVAINIGCTVVNVALNLALIPVFGIAGSAFAMVVTQSLIGVLTYLLVKKAGYDYPALGEAARITACALCMGAFVYWAHPYNLALIVACAAIIYGILILFTRSLSAEDLDLLSNVFRKKEA